MCVISRLEEIQFKEILLESSLCSFCVEGTGGRIINIPFFQFSIILCLRVDSYFIS